MNEVASTELANNTRAPSGNYKDLTAEQRKVFDEIIAKNMRITGKKLLETAEIRLKEKNIPMLNISPRAAGYYIAAYKKKKIR